MSIWSSSVRANATFLEFDSNVANKSGGGLSINYTDTMRKHMIEISANFSHNKAECGSAAYLRNDIMSIIFIKVRITDNHGSSLCLLSSKVIFNGDTQILRNVGMSGGGLSSKDSFLTFTGSAWFDGNTAQAGGAINSIQGEIAFRSTVLFTNNTADSDGGAIYAEGSNILLKNRAEFCSNSALNGGAMYLSKATLTHTCSTMLNTSKNHAFEFGGAIYHEDSPTHAQCNFRANDSNRRNDQFLPLPRCFLQSSTTGCYGHIQSYHDSAGKDGYFLYGGLLDKCRQNSGSQVFVLLKRLFDFKILTIIDPENTTVKSVSSEATKLHICRRNQEYQNNIYKEVFQGQRFTVPLVALAQAKTLIATQVLAITHSSRVRLLQKTQALQEGCSDMTYNLYSVETHDQLILYPDGPCKDSGLARVVIDVTFLPCPKGFTQSEEMCICEERLRAYNVECKVAESIQIVKRNNLNFWLSASHTRNGSYRGLILYDSCPAEYCKSQTVALTLDNLDA